MAIRRIHSAGAYEPKIGYCRAVVAGGFVHVAGTCGKGDTVVEQCRDALRIIGEALEQAGSGFADVVRVRYMLPDRATFEPCWPLLKDAFGDNPPAATMIECNLITADDLIEIEVMALAPAG